MQRDEWMNLGNAPLSQMGQPPQVTPDEKKEEDKLTQVTSEIVAKIKETHPPGDIHTHLIQDSSLPNTLIPAIQAIAEQHLHAHPDLLPEHKQQIINAANDSYLLWHTALLTRIKALQDCTSSTPISDGKLFDLILAELQHLKKDLDRESVTEAHTVEVQKIIHQFSDLIHNCPEVVQDHLLQDAQVLSMVGEVAKGAAVLAETFVQLLLDKHARLVRNQPQKHEEQDALLSHIKECRDFLKSLESADGCFVDKQVLTELRTFSHALLQEDVIRFCSTNTTDLLHITEFSPEHYKTGLEDVQEAPELPSDAKPLHEYVDELWNSLECNFTEVFQEVQKAEGERVASLPPEEAKAKLKERLDTYIRNIEDRIHILGFGREDGEGNKTYEKITKYLTAIFSKLSSIRNPDLTLKVLRDCIEGSSHCIMRYLEVSELPYLSICLGAKRDPLNNLLALCSDMRDRCAREVNGRLCQGDVHAFNTAKKELGEELGLPGWQSVVQEDIFAGEAGHHGYNREKFKKTFLATYTPEALINSCYAQNADSCIFLSSQYAI